MALETGTYISDLVITNPTSTDAKSDGDNHFRLIKSTLKATFANITGAVTKTHTQLNNALDKTGDSITGVVLYTGSSGMGYGTGAGGTVTQATSKTTAVTLNKPTGLITTHNAALAGGATVTFAVNNSAYSSEDVVHLVVAGTGSYRVDAYTSGPGVFAVRLTNTTGGSLSESVPIQFVIVKGIRA